MGEIKKMNVAFFDGEFTCHTNENRGIQELIQCSIFIYEVEIENDVLISMSKKPVWELSECVKPIYSKKLSSYIKKLTGISQNDVVEYLSAGVSGFCIGSTSLINKHWQKIIIKQ